jgi:hypothetical protein
MPLFWASLAFLFGILLSSALALSAWVWAAAAAAVPAVWLVLRWPRLRALFAFLSPRSQPIINPIRWTNYSRRFK